MKTILTILLTFFLLLVSGCKEESRPDEGMEKAPLTTYYFIRHAEKDRTDPNDIDPELNQQGLGRAMHWAEILDEVKLDAIYSTDFERSSMTAAPASVKQELTVQYFDPDSLDIEQFKSDNSGKNVLVVGHSNTTPAMVNKMIGSEKYSAMDDYDNGSLFIVQMSGELISDIRLHFNCHCPE